MYEGGANVLRLSYSVHRDLNVKNSGDKSRDFSMPLGVPSSGYHQHGHQHHHQQQQHYAPNPYDAGGHAPPPHHSGGQFGDEAPVTGALHEFGERSHCSHGIELSSHIAECMVMSSMLFKSPIFFIILKTCDYKPCPSQHSCSRGFKLLLQTALITTTPSLMPNGEL